MLFPGWEALFLGSQGWLKPSARIFSFGPARCPAASRLVQVFIWAKLRSLWIQSPEQRGVWLSEPAG